MIVPPDATLTHRMSICRHWHTEDGAHDATDADEAPVDIEVRSDRAEGTTEAAVGLTFRPGPCQYIHFECAPETARELARLLLAAADRAT